MGRGAVGLALILALFVGAGFALHARELPMGFEEPAETFPYGPVAAAVRQSFIAPGPYLSAVSVDLRPQRVGARGFSVNLRVREPSGEIKGETQIALKQSYDSQKFLIRLNPMAGSKGKPYVLEIQPAEGSDGLLFVPVHVRDAAVEDYVVDQDGVERREWTARFRLYQTLRPVAFFAALARSDPLTVAGFAATMALLTLAVGSLGARWAARSGSFAHPGFWYAIGVALALGIAWASYAAGAVR